MLRAGLERHCSTAKFLPVPSDVTDAIAIVKREREVAAAAANKFVPCAHCFDGWMFRPKVSITGVPSQEAYRCACYEDWRTARAMSAA
jgi:hypothetical protein